MGGKGRGILIGRCDRSAVHKKKGLGNAARGKRQETNTSTYDIFFCFFCRLTANELSWLRLDIATLFVPARDAWQTHTTDELPLTRHQSIRFFTSMVGKVITSPNPPSLRL